MQNLDGIVEFDSLKVADSVEGEAKSKIVLSRSGEIKLLDLETKKLLSSAHVPYGATLNVKEGQKVVKGDMLCSWDPFNALIISEFRGIIKFDSIEEGVTYRLKEMTKLVLQKRLLSNLRIKKESNLLFKS